MTDILSELCALRARDAEEGARREPLSALLARPETSAPRPSFLAALRRPAGSRARVNAELKKASPSKGLIRADFRPADLAAALTAGGASALSVLVEPHRFLGDAANLALARSRSALPLLWKDIVVSKWQVAKAAACGASAVLLIVAALSDARLRALLGFARDLGLDALVEAHNAAEIERALDLGARIVGVNSRDLRTFHTDPDAAFGLLARIPADRVRVAESGVRDAAGLRLAEAAGADAVLVGEALMRVTDPASALRELFTNDN
ncbi:MAG: indole-3-glycerol-phosphate synthase [Kiritimatiellae bacterium]|nr:indole-3-glycerol-phosphate synthase [Kiritimatiellia bacterium]